MNIFIDDGNMPSKQEFPFLLCADLVNTPYISIRFPYLI